MEKILYKEKWKCSSKTNDLVSDKKLKILNIVEKSDQIYLKLSTPVGRKRKTKGEEKQKRNVMDMEDWQKIKHKKKMGVPEE